MLIVTGAAGFVGKELSQRLSKGSFARILFIDKSQSELVNIQEDIAKVDLLKRISAGDEIQVIHLAATRLDYGFSPKEYWNSNVDDTERFLEALSPFKIKLFIHVSSVAALTGESIQFNDSLSSDDAYRATKAAQENTIRKYCDMSRTPLCVLYPSAIWEDSPRMDTNIGKLQKFARYLPIIPKIEVDKSLTNLERFCNFIDRCLQNNITGNFICIDRPVKSVTEIIRDFSNKQAFALQIPYLKTILLWTAKLNIVIAKCISKQPALTPGRVEKLFSDTSFRTASSDIDATSFNQ